MPLLEALDASPSALRRDDCGDPRIDGRWGHIYAVPGSLDRPNVPGFQIVVLSEKPETGAYDRWTARGWNVAKNAIKESAELTNDGDMDGTFFLDRLPTPAEAETIRRYCGIRQRAHYSEENLAKLRARGQALQGAYGLRTADEPSGEAQVAQELGREEIDNLDQKIPDTAPASDDGEVEVTTSAEVDPSRAGEQNP